ncbi:MAG: DUF2845 domain-containing protein [Nitrospirota bacterium]|jgi:hypothetical protein
MSITQTFGVVTGLASQLMALVVGLTVGVSSDASADTMRCGRFRVTVGDTKATVIKQCGDPLVREVVSGGEGATSVRTEQWIYDRGKGRFQALLIFEGVGLRSIRFLTDQ